MLPLFVAADVVAHDDPGILLHSAHPEQAVGIVVGVAVPENAARALEVGVVKAAFVIPRAIEVALVELEDGAAAAAGENRDAGAEGGVPADVALADATCGRDTHVSV